MDLSRPLIWEVNNRLLTWQDQLSGKDISSIMDMWSGGQRLQVFQPAVYKCFAEQELVAVYKPQPEAEEQQPVSKPQPGQEQEEAEAQEMKASSVLRGLQLMLLGGTILGLLGVIFALSRPSRNKKEDRVLLVK